MRIPRPHTARLSDTLQSMNNIKADDILVFLYIDSPLYLIPHSFTAGLNLPYSQVSPALNSSSPSRLTPRTLTVAVFFSKSTGFCFFYTVFSLRFRFYARRKQERYCNRSCPSVRPFPLCVLNQLKFHLDFLHVYVS